jgi:hypothetical protein
VIVKLCVGETAAALDSKILIPMELVVCSFYHQKDNFAAGGEEFYLLREKIQGIYVSKSFYQLESEKNILVISVVL